MGKIGFSDFVVFLAHSAYVALGIMEDPVTKKKTVDIDRAKESIDLIDMIKEKTRGNLTQDEETLLDEILYDLRLKFVEKLSETERGTGGEL